MAIQSHPMGRTMPIFVSFFENLQSILVYKIFNLRQIPRKGRIISFLVFFFQKLFLTYCEKKRFRTFKFQSFFFSTYIIFLHTPFKVVFRKELLILYSLENFESTILPYKYLCDLFSRYPLLDKLLDLVENKKI